MMSVIICAIFAVLFIIEVKFSPRLDWTGENLLLWYRIRNKANFDIIRDYIILF
jgi:hypothetical protein